MEWKKEKTGMPIKLMGTHDRSNAEDHGSCEGFHFRASCPTGKTCFSFVWEERIIWVKGYIRSPHFHARWKKCRVRLQVEYQQQGGGFVERHKKGRAIKLRLSNNYIIITCSCTLLWAPPTKEYNVYRLYWGNKHHLVGFPFHSHFFAFAKWTITHQKEDNCKH